MTENTKTTSAKKRPILFTAPMVRAILEGRKTQTRRLCKPAQDHALSFVVDCGSGLFGDEEGDVGFSCPYGQPGDRLWVRETFSGPHCMEASDDSPAMPPGKWPTESSIWYWADGEPMHGDWTRPRPSIHMPRWACRIALEIVRVRVERLQDISEADAEAEGCERLDSEREARDWKICPQCGGTRLYTAFSGSGGALPGSDCFKCDTYPKRYRHLWKSINGAGSWDANPWVWVVEFKRVEGGAA